MEQETKAVVDAIAVGGTVGTLAGWLPPLAALATIIWTCIRILETETVQKLFKKNEE